MRRFRIMLVGTVMTFSLASCGGVPSDSSESETVIDVSENDESSETAPSGGDGDSAAKDSVSESEPEDEDGDIYEIPDVEIEGEFEVPDTEAFQFVEDMKIGWSLGNTFDAYNDSFTGDDMKMETQWQSTMTSEEIIKGIHEAGFETIRIPVSWHNHFEDDDYTVSEDWMARVQQVVDWAMDDGMYVIINIHHDNHEEAGCFYPDSDHLDQSIHYIERIWTQLSERYIDYGDHLIFEAMNEPRLVGHENEWWINNANEEVKDSIECINVLNQTFVDVVRTSGGENAVRYLMCPGYDASSDGALNAGFRLPEDPTGPEGHILVSVHAYTPYNFALESPGIKMFDSDLKSSTRDIDTFMDKLYSRFVSKGIPVVIGEFGARDKNGNIQDRIDYAAYYIAAARARGMTALWWDNNSFSGDGENFGLYYRLGNYFLYEELVNALMKYAE